MNERLKELAVQAKVEHCISHVRLQEYGELIAYKCIGIALGSSHREDDMGAIIANKIREHFGVEE